MRHRVYTAFLDALKQDRAKTNVSKISSFGLIEMTRKRVRDSLLRSVCEPREEPVPVACMLVQRHKKTSDLRCANGGRGAK